MICIVSFRLDKYSLHMINLVSNCDLAQCTPLNERHACTIFIVAKTNVSTVSSN